MCVHAHTHTLSLFLSLQSWPFSPTAHLFEPVVSEETEPASITDSSLCLINPVRRTWGVAHAGRQVPSSHVPEAQGEVPPVYHPSA